MKVHHNDVAFAGNKTHPNAKLPLVTPTTQFESLVSDALARGDVYVRHRDNPAGDGIKDVLVTNRKGDRVYSEFKMAPRKPADLSQEGLREGLQVYLSA